MNNSMGDQKTLAGKTAETSASLAPGTVLGQYRIVRLLGRGGMGEVYEAEHQVLRRRYALKLLPATLDWQGVGLERFQREAQVMANLEHPNILRVDEFGETGGRYWLRMELAEGIECPVTSDRCSVKRVVSLQELADARGGKIPQAELLGILKQVLAGLEYAHTRGAIHRDLKPSNILLFPSPHHPNTPLAKISDFGLVRLVGEDWVRSQAQLSVQRSLSIGDQATMGKAESEGTSTRSLLGTYEYMSPEQKRGEEADARSDLYAVGVMTYRLLTGRNVGPKPPSRIDRELSPTWDEVVELALEEDAGIRLASAKDFADMLVRIDGATKAKSEPVAPVTVSVPVVAPTASDHRKPGETRELDLGGGVKLELVWIPPGEFPMGSPEDEEGRFDDEGPQHQVTISTGFWMGKYPVTQKQWRRVMGNNPSRMQPVQIFGVLNGGIFLGHPVENVSWTEAKEFCRKVGGRLPTEAEWEYACRAGTTGPYAGDLDRMAWYTGNADGTTHAVGQKAQNAWGLYDMHGNVWEWCEDGNREYSSTAQTDPRGPEGSSRVLRGGSWGHGAWFCRSAHRGDVAPGFRNGNVGFRLVVR